MERDFQKAMKGMTAFADSENTIICHSELDSESRSKTRCTLKNEDPLIAKGRDPDQKHCQDDIKG